MDRFKFRSSVQGCQFTPATEESIPGPGLPAEEKPPRIMNCLMTALLVIFLLGLSLQPIYAAPQGILEDTTCCSSVMKLRIRFGNLRHFYRTSWGCRRPAVVFVTLRNKEICADPKDKWVQNAIQRLEKKK